MGEDPKKSKDFARIVNKRYTLTNYNSFNTARHVQRIGNLLKGIDASKFVVGGPANIDEDDLYPLHRVPYNSSDMFLQQSSKICLLQMTFLLCKRKYSVQYF